MTAFTTLEHFDFAMEHVLQPMAAERPSNVEYKVLVRPKTEATLSPTLITDRDVVMTFDDAAAGFHWGIRFQSPQYLALFTRWFDDLWASIPDSYLIYSRSGFDQSAIEVIGVSFDSVADNAAFARKYKFGFKLLSDITHEVALAYGACENLKARYPERISFLIDAGGRIERVYDKVDPRDHAAQVLAGVLDV